MLALKAMPLNWKHCFWKLRGGLSWAASVSSCLFSDCLGPSGCFLAVLAVSFPSVPSPLSFLCLFLLDRFHLTVPDPPAVFRLRVRWGPEILFL